MNLILTLMHEYQDISAQLAYNIRKQNIVAIDIYERHQRQAAMKLVVALIGYQGIDVEEVAAEVEKTESDG